MRMLVAGFAVVSVVGTVVDRTTLANDLSRDEEVVCFPTYAVLDPAAPQTTLFVRGWIFEPEPDSLSRKLAVSAAAKLLGLDDTEAANANFERRVRLFLVDNEQNQQVLLRIGPREVPLGKSEANGHMRALLTLPTAELQKLVTRRGREPPTLDYRVVTPPGDARLFRGRVHLLAPEGWSIVSDIDDTTKISNVADRRELLRNTFVRDFQTVPGMAEAYRRWASEGAAFHYVTTSPWQLWQALEQFADADRYPRGSYHMRHFRLQDGSALDMLEAPDRYKSGTIEELIKAQPKRQFVLVGDSGERDPEIYGELARKYPSRIRLVAIRNITDETLDNDRMKAAWADIPADKRLLFRDAGELPALKALAAPKSN